MASMHKKSVAGTIMEQDGEESDFSAVNIVTKEEKTKLELLEKSVVIDKYKRIDQVTLNRVGLK